MSNSYEYNFQVSDEFQVSTAKSGKNYLKIPEFTKFNVFFWESEDIKKILAANLHQGDSFICDIEERKNGQYVNYYGKNPRNFKRAHNTVTIPAHRDPEPPTPTVVSADKVQRPDVIDIDQDINYLREMVHQFEPGTVKGYYQKMVAEKLAYHNQIQTNVSLADIDKHIVQLNNILLEFMDKFDGFIKDMILDKELRK